VLVLFYVNRAMSMMLSEKKHSHHQFIASGGSSNRPIFTTRHLAALDFLLNIPMARESEIKQTGINNTSKAKGLEKLDGEGASDEEAVQDALSPVLLAGLVDEYGGMTHPEFAGKKLRGPLVPTAHLPLQMRYNLQRAVTDQSAVVRQWEDQLLSTNQQTARVSPTNASSSISSGQQQTRPLLSSRIFCSRTNSYPTLVFSVIKYDAGEEKAKFAKLRALDNQIGVFEIPKRDWRGCSYKSLFRPLAELYKDRGTASSVEYNLVHFDQGCMHDPNFIDDPGMLHGSHKFTPKRTAATGPIISSVIFFVDKSVLKDSLNDKFREKHPHFPPKLTLSKIRNLKKITLLHCLSIGIEVSTVAIAVICFERLCLKGIVTKPNRRLCMAVSLLLAFKFNEPPRLDSCPERKERYNKLLEFFDDEWDITKRQVFEAEFGAYMHLGFSLHFPSEHIRIVYTRLLKLVNKTSKQYLGNELNQTYEHDFKALAAVAKEQKEIELLHRQQKQKQDEPEGSVADVNEDQRDLGSSLLRSVQHDQQPESDGGSGGIAGSGHGLNLLSSIREDEEGPETLTENVNDYVRGGTVRWGRADGSS
jgi:hypothetical protein